MNQKTILVADDEPWLREILSIIIEEKGGMRCLLAADAERALAMARTGSPDLLVLDVKMPGTSDGYDVARQLKADPRTARIPILMLSALAARTDRLWGLEQGADDYLAKPFDPDQLLARIEALLRRDPSGPGAQAAKDLFPLRVQTLTTLCRYF